MKEAQWHNIRMTMEVDLLLLICSHSHPNAPNDSIKSTLSFILSSNYFNIKNSSHHITNRHFSSFKHNTQIVYVCVCVCVCVCMCELHTLIYVIMIITDIVWHRSLCFTSKNVSLLNEWDGVQEGVVCSVCVCFRVVSHCTIISTANNEGFCNNRESIWLGWYN